MNKNIPKFFISCSTAVLMTISTMAAFPQSAAAYAVNATGSNVSGGNYDFGSSFQNLLSPFTSFINQLQLNSNTTIKTNGAPGYTPPANMNIAPGVGTWIMQQLTNFDNWFYGISGIRLSQITYVILNLLQWVLQLATGIVNWLLGLFH